MRFAVLSIAVLACLAAPGRAAAHSRAPTVALDYRLELSRAVLPGVHAEVVDGDRALRVRVDSPHRLLVLGLLGEPLSRFGPRGVWANRASPSAAANKLVRRGTGWVRLTTGRSLLWHDHRLSPPARLRPGESAAWSLPLALDGRRTRVGGDVHACREAAGLALARRGARGARRARRVRPRRAAAPCRDGGGRRRSRGCGSSCGERGLRDGRRDRAGAHSGSRSGRPGCSPCSRQRRWCSATGRCARGRRWSSASSRRRSGSGRSASSGTGS